MKSMKSKKIPSSYINIVLQRNFDNSNFCKTKIFFISSLWNFIMKSYSSKYKLSLTWIFQSYFTSATRIQRDPTSPIVDRSLLLHIHSHAKVEALFFCFLNEINFAIFLKSKNIIIIMFDLSNIIDRNNVINIDLGEKKNNFLYFHRRYNFQKNIIVLHLKLLFVQFNVGSNVNDKFWNRKKQDQKLLSKGDHRTSIDGNIIFKETNFHTIY